MHEAYDEGATYGDEGHGQAVSAVVEEGEGAILGQVVVSTGYRRSYAAWRWRDGRAPDEATASVHIRRHRPEGPEEGVENDGLHPRQNVWRPNCRNWFRA